MTVIEDRPAERPRRPSSLGQLQIIVQPTRSVTGMLLSSIEMLAGRVCCRCGHARRCLT